MRRSPHGSRLRIWQIALGLIVLSLSGGCGDAPPSDALPKSTAPPPILPAKWSGVAKTGSFSTEKEETEEWPFHRDIRNLSWWVMALTAYEKTTGDPSYHEQILSAIDILKASQWDESRGCPTSHPFFGGVSQFGSCPPDLTHTALALQALRDAGVSADDPFLRRALDFIARCQVPPSVTGEKRDRSESSHEGGFAARPVAPHSSPETTIPPTQRPCGGTTCLALTSLLAAGVSPEDPRIQQALKWLQERYTLDAHPGAASPNEGLFGYYLEFAKAMTRLRRDHIQDRQGVSHNWRDELIQTLTVRQNPNGSWTNPEESPDPNASTAMTITSYALLTLDQLGRVKSEPKNSPQPHRPPSSGTIVRSIALDRPLKHP